MTELPRHPWPNFKASLKPHPGRSRRWATKAIQFPKRTCFPVSLPSGRRRSWTRRKLLRAKLRPGKTIDWGKRSRIPKKRQPGLVINILYDQSRKYFQFLPSRISLLLGDSGSLHGHYPAPLVTAQEEPYLDLMEKAEPPPAILGFLR